ncbi:uncharacterized protein LOC128449062 [Pleuronectes platessa]|uniref:uncharacterized protein LOC128449062 n=1 Tax=Pleuronectes platessa TaxID=8262 RepID=UPI00232A65A2|nr:uncharacterized protein LOC128449062 [Pleuronectes platessa]
MPSLIMEREQQSLQNILEDGLGRDLMDAGRFCFNCEQIFSDRRSLELHMCLASTHICSCGTEYTKYADMLDHSTTHEPGHQVLDHETIRKRRIEKRIAEEEQLIRLQTGDVIWEAPKLNIVPSKSLAVMPMLQVPIKSAYKPQVPMQSAQISQVPQLYPSASKASLPQKSVSSVKGVKNVFAGVGAPTVDLWTLYQPVVLLKTSRRFNKIMPYGCGKCGQCFSSKMSLITHHGSHVTDKVSGCIGCGLLLSSKKLVPRFHVCNSPSNVTKLRLITARPVGFKMPKEASMDSQKLITQGPQACSSIQVKRQYSIVTNKGVRRPFVPSNLQLKRQDIRKYHKSDQGRHVTPSLQSRIWSPSTSKLYNTVSLPSESQSPSLSASNKSSHWIPHSMQTKMPTNIASAASSKPTQMSPTTNGFKCRVCHLPFESAQLLQRHKCIRAREFMAQQGPAGRQQYKIKILTPGTSPVPIQMNGERRFQVPAAGNMKKSQVVAVDLGREQDEVLVNKKTGVDMDDDCYIVESGPEKPAEMIYQVTSSVPIKT